MQQQLRVLDVRLRSGWPVPLRVRDRGRALPEPVGQRVPQSRLRAGELAVIARRCAALIAASVMTARRLSASALLVAVAASCGAPVADPSAFCEDELFWSCRRDRIARRITEAEERACMAPIAGCEPAPDGGVCACAGVTWPPGCTPTVAQAQACIDLLRDPRLLATPTETLLAGPSACDLCP